MWVKDANFLLIDGRIYADNEIITILAAIHTVAKNKTDSISPQEQQNYLYVVTGRNRSG